MTTIREWKTAQARGKHDAEKKRSVELAAESSLQQTGYSELSSVVCEFEGGTLTLRGRVPGCDMKQIANTVVATVEGVVRIDNRLDIID